MSPKILTRITIYATIYVVLTLIFSTISYGPIQFRISEFLTVFPFIDPLAIPGLFIGCFIANFFSPAGWIDVIFGSLFTLIAGYLTYKMPRIYLAPLPPIIVNALGVSLYLHLFFKLPYLLNVLYIAIGEAVVTYLIGLPILLYIQRNPSIKEKFFGMGVKR
ncbi:MAG: QueT transporter family protein [Dictyoglomus sp.]|nr:QueT transporter family protein [Dictyoglomus sp.]MCX7941997.1 QueT transporter family protein [Dictyoglomaceae bacterium]MDW8188741.1 QueT transporter family protein [Dictyoglomus sp.]